MNPEAQVGVEVLVGGDISAPALQAHLHVDLAALADGADVNVLVENLDVAVGLDHARGDDAGRVGAQVQGLGAFARQLEGDLLQVEDDVGRVLDHAADGLELVQHALDADGGYGRPLDRRQQRAPQRIADRGAEAALKRLRGKLSVLLGECIGVGGKTLGFLEASPKHGCFSFVRLIRDAFCEGGVVRLRARL